ncbi:Crp/Fnr family transcriptional regulator [Hymenobacter aerilatus]|uniref:Crp/Fnr family transcriptional regulator n=1 Tax=Hymenobacter aerilatus TaxID=2932251 RepID=A0A8T9T2S0_9BACT|nr:Crp/Fnr family transcriptional regulator [Hymenobacter aerilatus]UOR06416.1 Crp/Fnr family transcriptional regulator [Hymenobacter aerilatus]
MIPPAAFRSYFQRHLSGLPEEQVAALAALLTPRTLRRHEVLVHQDEVGRHGAFVLSGCLRAYVTDAKGKEHILQFAPESWWIADQYGLLHQAPAQFSIDAVEASDVLLFGPDFYPQLRQLGPELQQFFYELLQNSVAAMQHRLIGVLSATAEARYLDFQQRYPTLAQRLPLRHIAAYLGITPESLSRLRRELARG